MAKYTALEWFYEKTVINHKTNYYELFEQAKQMEKEQIKDAYIEGEHQQGFQAEAEQYYNETYNK